VEVAVYVWLAFLALILCLLALDLGVFHRHSRIVSAREGFAWSLVWMTLALLFAVVVYAAYDQKWSGLGLAPDAADRTAALPLGIPNDGTTAVIKYVTGYVIELSLSVDNMFVIAMLFRFFAVPPAFQHRVLFWGILGALAMRGVMITVGIQLISHFAWMLYVFGIFLIGTGLRMMFMDTGPSDPRQTLIVRTVRRWLPVTAEYHGERFLVRAAGGALCLTPLALALLLVEATDLLFAVDSIPAILAVTADPFLVFASNAFAILGLRSLYFALAGALDAFHYLKYSLATILVLIGVKMLAHGWLREMLGEHFHLYVLAAVLATLAAGVGASLLLPAAPDPAGRTELQ
jgi:tellurite resistance protein TerC